MSQAHLGAEPQSAAPRWSDPGKGVDVGVDGSQRNRAALAWAAAEAGLTQRPLTLVHVLDERRVPSPFHGPETDDRHAWQLLDGIESELRGSAPSLVVRKDVAVGPVASALVERSADQFELVVGRRGVGTFRRLLLGSTSLDVTSRAEVPVVVVPDGWGPSERTPEPVVVGIDPRKAQPGVLHHAFTQARARRVPLVAAHGRDVPDLDSDTSGPDGAVERGQPDVSDALESLLDPYRSAYPDVEVTVLDRTGHPLAVLLDEVGPTQLLVLGRRSDDRRGGFVFGSVAHGVLHYAEVPVVIVPPVS